MTGTLVVHAGAAGAATTISGLRCTITGTSSANTLRGTPGPDVICGLGGNDTIYGGGGNDVIDGGGGNDTLYGGVGTDRLLGSSGNDVLNGGPGPDTLNGGDGTDTVSYAGHTAGVKADLNGVRDDGTPGERDLILANVENLTGGNGADVLTGSNRNNVLSGGAGNDTLRGLEGSDTFVGGSGTDTGTYSERQSPVSVSLDGQRNDGSFAAGTNIHAHAVGALSTEGDQVSTDIENVTGGSGADMLSGSESANTLQGGAGADDLVGLDGADQLIGSNGDDSLSGGSGNDYLNGGPGHNVLDGGTGANVCVFTPEDNVTASCDSRAPVVVSVSAPSPVDTSTSAQVVTVHAVVTDDLSGVSCVFIDLSGPNNQLIQNGCATLTSGDDLNGTYALDLTLPRYAQTGAWTVQIQVDDKASNHGNYNNAATVNVA